nr:flocculation protein FLO11 isoform X1 [Ipomoea batatas]
MECYERIEKPNTCTSHLQLSPKKLRSMLLGTQKRRKPQAEEEEEEEEEEEDDPELGVSLRSESEIHESEAGSENCKDVAVVSVLHGSSREWEFGSSIASEMVKDRLKDQSLVTSRFRSQDLNCDGGGLDGMVTTSSPFEFQKAERAQRVPVAPFSKPAPSKWDDAQKWIASPTSNRPRSQGGQGVGPRKASHYGHGNLQVSTKHVSEVSDRRVVHSEEPADTKLVDSSHAKDNAVQKYLSWESESHPVAESYGKATLMIENCTEESAINLSRHDSCVSIHSATAFVPLPSTARSVSMRDMGTEMTPIASQEPSRTGTPVRATTPTRSPTSSRPSTPGAAPSSSLINHPSDLLDPQRKELFEKELQMKTRREIMALGTKLGKMNIAAWASNDDDDKNEPTLQNAVGAEQSSSVVNTRAAAWEEAENAKYMARFQREEIKIQAWENHQIAKAEAEIRKTEVKVERMRARAQDELMNKLASVRHKAEEKRAAAEARRNDHASKSEKQAEHIRRTGRVPSSCCCFHW